MKKSIFYFAMAACVALCNISCGGDDGDNNGGNDVNLRTPKYLYQAFTVTDPSAIGASVDGAPQLTRADITKMGNVVFELKEADGSHQYVIYKLASASNSIYTLADGKGTISSSLTKAATRNSTTVTISLDISVEYVDANGKKVTVHYTGENIAAMGITEDVISNVIQTYLERTWMVDAMIIDLEGDVTGYKEFSGGNLKQISDYAIQQGTHLTAEEQEELDKTISNVIVDNNLFVLNYSKGMPDVGSWSWGSSDYSSIKVTLKDGKMGNKYINNNSAIALKFSSNMCVMVFKTSVSDSQNYKATLTVRLKDSYQQ